MIREQDIRFAESEVMDDVPEGGGASTGRDIVDGQMNNVFPDISDLDRLMGDLALRKVFVEVRTALAELYGGVKTLITRLPTDRQLSYVLFTRDDAFDRRTDAQNVMEAYYHKSVIWDGFLLSNHVAGQAQIQIFQRPNTSPPQPGETLALVYNEGLPGEREQYVRVTRATAEERLFYDSRTNLDFSALVVTCQLSGQLLYDFPGSEPSREFAGSASATKIRTVNAVDAARYYSASRLTTAAAVGDREITIDSIFTQLAPASQTGASVVDIQIGGNSVDTVSGGSREAAVSQVSHTDMEMITELNALINYTNLLRPLPSPGTLTVQYRSQGQRYVLRDATGDGSLSGAGAGRVNYTTGSTEITLLAIPDIGSAILYQWGSGAHYQRRTLAEITTPQWYFETQHKGIEPGEVAIVWQVGGEDKSVTDDGNGNLIGDGVGTINYSLGQVFLRPNDLPEPNTTPRMTYKHGGVLVEDYHPSLDGNGFIEIRLRNAPAVPRSITVECETIRSKTDSEKSVI